MKSALQFLLAAKRFEIRCFEQLAVTCELVNDISQLVHKLQKERGVSSGFVASQGAHFGAQLGEVVAECDEVQGALRKRFDLLLSDEAPSGSSGVRLFSRIAYVVNGLAALPRLREQVREQRLSVDEISDAYTKLIGGLLAVVFEAADTAADPDISRALVAMFNFMQGKELAGQERAAGAIGFARQAFDTPRQQKLHYLVDAQQRCFDIFAEFAAPALLASWREALPAADIAEFERLRRVATIGPVSGLAADSDEVWFELASRRIDAMKQLEDRLAVDLSQLCHRKMQDARNDLENHHDILESLDAMEPHSASAVAVFFEHGTRGADGGAKAVDVLGADGMGPQLGRSILDLVHQQARRLQSMNDELQSARTALNDRKLIERAKGLLMTHRNLTEDQAYRMLRQTAMDQERRLADVAQTVLSFSGILKDEPHRK